MLIDKGTGDSSCFTCGHIAYGAGIITLTPGRLERRPSHGGTNLA